MALHTLFRDVEGGKTMYSQVNRGDLYYADLDPTFGSEQGGKRPVLIVQNDVGNYYSPTTIVAALTTNIQHKHFMPTHQLIRAREGLRFDSIILLEQIRVIDKMRLMSCIGSLKDYEMQAVNQKLLVSLGIVSL